MIDSAAHPEYKYLQLGQAYWLLILVRATANSSDKFSNTSVTTIYEPCSIQLVKNNNDNKL